MAPIGVTGIVHAGRPRRPRRRARLGDHRRAADGLDAVERPAGGRGDGDAATRPASSSSTRRKDRELAESLVRRAEAAGYKAIVVTLDTWVTGWRPRDLNTGNFPQLRGHVLTELFRRSRSSARCSAKPPEEDPARRDRRLWAAMFGKVLTWDDMAWLRSLTKLPIVLKGICHPDDARRAIDAGADGDLLLEPRRAAGQRRDRRDRHAARRRRGVAATCRCCSIRASARAATWSRRWRWARARSASGGPIPTASRSTARTGAAHVLRCILAEADLLMAVNGYPTIADVRAAGAVRTG